MIELQPESHRYSAPSPLLRLNIAQARVRTPLSTRVPGRGAPLRNETRPCVLRLRAHFGELVLIFDLDEVDGVLLADLGHVQPSLERHEAAGKTRAVGVGDQMVTEHTPLPSRPGLLDDSTISPRRASGEFRRIPLRRGRIGLSSESVGARLRLCVSLNGGQRTPSASGSSWRGG